MSQTDENVRSPQEPVRRTGRGLGLPPWLVSIVLHIALIVAIGLTLRVESPRGVAGERTADVGIALKRQDGQKEYFVDQTEAGQTDARSDKTAEATISREQMLGDAAPAEAARVLPSAPPVLGAGALGDEGLGDASGAARGSPGRGDAGKGTARVRVFGAEGEGYKFVYVFDRSGSMGGSGSRALRAAKAELLASLESLNRTHQFQIIFYNERPVQYNLSGQPGRLVFGDDRTKRLAARYVGGIRATGATRHEEALMQAIRMRPDVIFFLTDADEPRLSAGQIHDISRAAAGITINAIEFGSGPQKDRDNYLQRLARACGGQYRYVNVWELK